MTEVKVGSGRIDAELDPEWAVFFQFAGKLLGADQSCTPLLKLSNRICHGLHREFEMRSQREKIKWYSNQRTCCGPVARKSFASPG
jgi:hypothetical protein